MKLFTLSLFLILVLCTVSHGAIPWIDAIAIHESGNRPLPKRDDTNTARTEKRPPVIGHFQISYAYWKDATDHDPSIGGTWEDCINRDYGVKIVNAYMDRYAKGKSDEYKSRVHNGGPNGHKLKSTKAYWLSIKAIMER